MKSAVTGITIAVLLFIAGGLAWSEAKLTRRVAEAHQRLATLHYDLDDSLDSTVHVWNRLPWPLGSAGTDVQRHESTVKYWTKGYDELTESALSGGGQPINDAVLLLVSANASYRDSEALGGDHTADRKAEVERLDNIIRAYADVLRKDGTATDAAFNLEFVAKERDLLAVTPAKGAKQPEIKKATKPDLVSADLPTGGTVHGKPGGPPEGTDMSEFKTITPMRYDEREEEMSPSKGSPIRRKG